MNKEPLPIDNKNIMEWFTEDFHNDHYLEIIEDKITKQVFFMNDCLCEVSYRFGQNWFKFRVIEGKPDNVKICYSDLNDIVKAMNSEENEYRVLYNPIVGIYEFYYVGS